MSAIEACEFFAHYGNVSGVAGHLLATVPTPGQVREAVRAAVDRFGRSEREANEAADDILRHHGLSYGPGGK